MIRRIVASSRSHGWSLTHITLAKAVVGMVTFKEHTDFVQHAMFSSDGGMQCSGGLDGMVLIHYCECLPASKISRYIFPSR